MRCTGSPLLVPQLTLRAASPAAAGLDRGRCQQLAQSLQHAEGVVHGAAEAYDRGLSAAGAFAWTTQRVRLILCALYAQKPGAAAMRSML